MMKILRNVMAVMATLVLSGCYSMDYRFDFKADGTVDEALINDIPRNVWDSPFFDSTEVCADSKIIPAQTNVICKDADTYDLRYVLEQTQSEFPVMEQEFFPIQLSQPNSNEITVNIDIRSAIQTIDNALNMSMIVGMADATPAFKNAFKCSQISFTFSGAEVISTTGRVIEDGKTAQVSFPMKAFVDPSLAPETFQAHLIIRKCLMFGLFCS